MRGYCYTYHPMIHRIDYSDLSDSTTTLQSVSKVLDHISENKEQGGYL